MQTFSNTTTATLNDNTNIGFTPEKTYLVDGNDKIIVESFDSLQLGSFNISDPSVKDLDVLTVALSPENTSVTSGAATFGSGTTQIKNIETIHINTTGNITSISNNANLEGIKVLEIAGDAGNLYVNNGSGVFNVGKIDASGITVGNVHLTAATDTTELVGGAGSDELTIGKEGGILTGNAGADKFYVGNARDKLVTITDIASKDSVIFDGANLTNVANKKAVELTITDASDETTFVDALQKAANKEASNGLYYAEFNGNTYVVANGQAGTKINSVNNAELAVSAAEFELASVSAATSAITPKPTASISATTSANITGILSIGGGKMTYSASTHKISTTAQTTQFDAVTAKATLSKDTYSGDLTFSGGTLKGSATVKEITVNGTKYLFEDFTSVNIAANSGTIINATAKFSAGTIKDDGAFAGGTGKATITGISGVTFDGVLANNESAMKDDIIVKLAGSHTLTTEAVINNNSLDFV